MEIKKGTLVALIGDVLTTGQLGIIAKKLSSERFIVKTPIAVKTPKGVVVVGRKEILPLAENCGSCTTIGEALLGGGIEVATNLISMVANLQKQNEALLSKIGSVNEALEKTQGQLRDHLSKPH